MKSEISGLKKKTINNLYHWSLNEAELEIKQDFPMIKNIQGTGVKTYINYLNMFPLEMKLKISKTLVKRIYVSSLEPNLEMLTNDEKIIIDEFSNYYLSNLFNNPFSQMKGLTQSFSKSKISTKRLSDCIKIRLREFCGAIQESSVKSEWIHSQTIGRWTVNTIIIVKSQGQQLRYYHSLILDKNLPLNILIDKLRWMGVSEIEWNQLKEDDEEIACQQLTNLCFQFMQALPKLLVS